MNGLTLDETLQSILCPTRLNALESSDVPPIPYNTYSFFSNILSFRGRNFSMLAAPLLSLFLWGLCWWILFHYDVVIDEQGTFQAYVASLSGLVAPLVTPLSFLMTFRLGRAAVRFWEARSSSGKIVAVCRCNIAMVCASLIHNQRRQLHKKNAIQIENDMAMALLCEYARWLAAFPVAVKHFLRPTMRPGWEKDDVCHHHTRLEMGQLLPEKDYFAIMKEYKDENGNPSFDSGVRVRDSPLVVLNHLHRLAYDILDLSFPNSNEINNHHDISFLTRCKGRGALFQILSDQINQLFNAYGAMERIKSSPLPFIYAIHLRFFLLVYLYLWNMISVAEYGWLGLRQLRWFVRIRSIIIQTI